LSLTGKGVRLDPAGASASQPEEELSWTAIFISHRSTERGRGPVPQGLARPAGAPAALPRFRFRRRHPGRRRLGAASVPELRRCQAVLIALTPAWHESMWCHIELAIAREKGKAVFVARMKRVSPGR